MRFNFTYLYKKIVQRTYATCAPNIDLQLINPLINTMIFQRLVKKKIMKNFWYLSDELIGLKCEIINAMINKHPLEVHNI